MARYYQLLMAFENQNDAENCVPLFQDRQYTLSSGRTFSCKASQWTSNENLFWVACEPEGVSLGTEAVPWVENSGQLDEVASLLYQSLVHVKNYRCAIAGWEVADLFLPDPLSGYTDMRIKPDEFLSPGWSGLVITISMWTGLGNPASFQPYFGDYVWQPYLTLPASGW